MTIRIWLISSQKSKFFSLAFESQNEQRITDLAKRDDTVSHLVKEALMIKTNSRDQKQSALAIEDLSSDIVLYCLCHQPDCDKLYMHWEDSLQCLHLKFVLRVSDLGLHCRRNNGKILIACARAELPTMKNKRCITALTSKPQMKMTR